MKLSDLHTHTVFSDGKNTAEEMVRSAVSRGLLSFGISDHSFTQFDKSYCMQEERIGEYIAEINRLKEKYAGQIQLYLGIELDAGAELFEREKYDYIIADSHYVKTSDGFFGIDESKELFSDIAKKYFGGDTVRLAVEYFDGYVKGIEKHRPDILGHIDLVQKFSLVDARDARYRNAALSALVASLEISKIVELNTGALSRGYRAIYPSRELLGEIKAHGGKIILSSDSHSAQNIAFAFEAALELVRSAGINSIVVLDKGKLEEVGI